MYFYLKISSKDNKRLKKFVQYISKLEYSPIILKYFAKQKKRKFVSVLKSPHVNKTAQEQFEFRFYSKSFLIHSLKPLTYFFIFKKLRSKSFSGLNFEIKGIFNRSEKSKILLKVSNPNNVISQNIYNSKSNSNLKLSQMKYIQLFDYYGEVCLNNKFYNR